MIWCSCAPVLVISCLHALGLAIALTTAISSPQAARHGILIKERLAHERSRTLDAVLFDKTGTLTKSEHVVVGVAPAGDFRSLPGRGVQATLDGEACQMGGRAVRQRALAGQGITSPLLGPSVCPT